MRYSTYLTLFLCSIILVGCTSVPNLLEKGKFDQAYSVALKHCTSGRAQRPFSKARKKALDQFEDAYAAVQSRDYSRALFLRKRPEDRRWIELFDLYSSLYSRSSDLVKIVPGTNQLRLHPGLRPAILEAQREEARRNAGNYYLALVAPELPAAFAGEKPAARNAHANYQSALTYLPERGASLLDTIDQLHEIGTLRILLSSAEQTDFYGEMKKALQSLKEYDRAWTQIVTDPLDRRIDLDAEIKLLSYQSPGFSETSSCSNYSKEVLDYIEKVKKEVKVNDSTTVTIIEEVHHYKTIQATVTTYEQSLSVSAMGQLAIYQPTSAIPEWRQEFISQESWSNEYSICSGDQRALPAFAGSGRRQSPPSELFLLRRAVCSFPYKARNILIRRYVPPALRSRLRRS